MKIVLCNDAKEVCVFEKADAAVLLFHNKEGVFYFFVGSENLVHATFVQGCLDLPFLIPEDTDTREEARSLLNAHCTERNEPFIKALVSGETQQSNPSGQQRGMSISVCADTGAMLTTSAVEDALIFVSLQGAITTRGLGWGLEKKELMFFGAEILFGKDVGDALRRIIYVKEIMLPDGREVIIDSTDIMRDILRAMRANPAVTNGIILTSAMWNVLAEEQARKGNIPQSLN